MNTRSTEIAPAAARWLMRILNVRVAVFKLQILRRNRPDPLGRAR